jgi:hypothetical protein
MRRNFESTHWLAWLTVIPANWLVTGVKFGSTLAPKSIT